MKSVFKEQIYRKYFQIMAKVSRIKMKNGKHYLFNGLTRVTCSFQFFIHSSNLFVQSYRVLALHVSFPTLLYFYFIRFIRINLIIGTFSKPVHSSRFIPLVFPISFSFFLFPIHRFHFRLSFIFFFHQAQSHPLIVRFSSYHLSIYFLNFCYLFPRIMNSLVVCSIQPSPPPPRSIPFTLPKIFQFRIAARNPSSIENVCPAHPNRIYDLGLLKNGTDRGRDYQVTRTACYSSFIKPPPVAQ